MKLFKFVFQLIKRNRLLFLIILLGIFFRFWGVVPGYLPYHSDEHQSWAVASEMLFKGGLHPDYYAYPSLVPLIHMLFYLIIFVPFSFIAGLFTYSDTKTIVESMIANSLYWGRYVNAFLGTISILLVYILASRFWNKFVGLTAAIFLAVNYRHVLQSHFALFDIANGLFLILVLLVSLNIMWEDKKVNYLWAGIASALSFSVKFFPFGFVSVLLAHVLKKQFFARLASKKFWLMLFLTSAVFIIAVSLLNLPHLLNFSESQKYLEYLAFKYRTGNYSLITYPYLYLYHWGLGPVLSFLVILGVARAFVQKFRLSLILLAPVLFSFYSLTFFSVGGIYVRNFVGIIPILLIFSAVGVFSLFTKFHGAVGRAVVTVIVVLAILPHVTGSVVVGKYYSQPWNLSQARPVLIEDLKGKKVAGDNWFLDCVFMAEDKWFLGCMSIGREITKVNFSPNTNFALPELEEAGADYVLVDTGFTERFFTWWMGKDFFTDVPQDLLYQTFAGSVIHELVARRDKEWIKPWQAYENNFFLVPIPKPPADFVPEQVYKEDFENPAGFLIKGVRGGAVVDASMGQTLDKDNCVERGCAFLRHTKGQGFKYRTFGTMRLASPPIEVKEKYFYKVKVKMKVSPKLPKGVRDGFFKVELFKTREDAQKDGYGNIVFVSARIKDDNTSWIQEEVFADIPPGYKFMTVGFQTYDNRGDTFYFDDLVIEKSLKPQEKEIERKPFPEDVIFTNSII